MTQFEYISVLISIVLGLGMTEILVCWARLIQHRNMVRFSVLQGFWSVFILLMMVQFWWGFWSVSEITEFSLGILVLMFIQTGALVIAILLLIPGRILPEQVALDDYYFNNYRYFFLLLCVMLVISTFLDLLLLDLPAMDFDNFVRIVGAFIALIIAFVSNRKVHHAIPYLAIALFTVFIFV